MLFYSLKRCFLVSQYVNELHSLQSSNQTLSAFINPLILFSGVQRYKLFFNYKEKYQKSFSFLLNLLTRL
jgi:hypothetical protein